MEDLNRKYIPMENVLNHINSNFIALPDTEKKRNTKILEQVTTTIITLMKQKDTLFREMYERNFYGGSYFDNLKVGKPNEYDLDLVLNLPKVIGPCVKYTDHPGFVHVVISEYNNVKKSETDRKKYEEIDKLLDKENYYLLTGKVLIWMERVFDLARNAMPKEGSETYVDVSFNRNGADEHLKIFVKVSKGPPAFTMRLSGKDTDGSDIQLDIDLVPCFQFDNKNWPDPSGGYRCNPSKTKTQFLVVPKRPKGEAIDNSPLVGRYWRLSFQEQERELIGKDLKTLKPSIRLLKKLRDHQKHKIASYFIKTVFLWTLEEEEDSFWVRPLSVVFMSMLKKYAERIRDKNIPYYWNSQFNLISCYLKDSTKTDVANALKKIVADVERNLTEPSIDPFTIGKYLLFSPEYEELKVKVCVGKKVKKSLTLATTSSTLNGDPTLDTPDSKSVTSPPMIKNYNFEPAIVESIKKYSDLVEERSKRDKEDIMAQINCRSNGFPNNNDVLTYLMRIDEKMDKMLENFDKSAESNKDINSKLASLEEQVKQLQLENKYLKSKLDKTENVNSIDAVLSIRQIDEDNKFLMN